MKNAKHSVEHTQLLEGCFCSQFTVYPANWNDAGAEADCQWRFHYRFYDPAFKDNPKLWGKLVIVKGANSFRTLRDKRKVMQQLLDDEKQRVHEEGWNPVRELFMKPKEEEVQEYVIAPSTPLIEALEAAKKVKTCGPDTKICLTSVIKYTSQAAKLCGLYSKPVSEFRKNHIQVLLKFLGMLKGDKWTDNNFNFYRSHLSMLFTELEELGAIVADPVKTIKKKKVLRPKRKTLTPAECEAVDTWAREWDTRFWLLIHIFFHSGARTTEMMKVQTEHVDLVNQKVSYQVLKGQTPEWLDRPIKDVALPFWQAALQGCKPGQFIFSRRLKPGPVSIDASQLTRRWKRHIKKKLEIDCDWYALKHLNSDQMSAQDGLRAAMEQNGHKSASTTKIYAIGESAREMERARKIANPFAGQVNSIAS